MHRRKHDYQSLLPASPQHHQQRQEQQPPQPHYGTNQHHHQHHALDGHRAWHHGALSGGAVAGYQDAAPETWSQQQPLARRPTARTTPALNLPPAGVRPKPKQPNRTTKTSQKLTLFPEDNEYDSTVRHDQSMPTGVDRAYAPCQRGGEAAAGVPQMPHGNARLEAERLSKLDRRWLPRVAAYCTASSYRLDELIKYLQTRKLTNGASPKQFDEVVYTPYTLPTGHFAQTSPPSDFGNVSPFSGATAGVATRDGWSAPSGQHQQLQKQQTDGDTTEDLRPTLAEHRIHETVGGSGGDGKLSYAGSDGESDAATGGSSRASKPRSQRNFSRGRTSSLHSITRVADSVPATPFSVAAPMHLPFGEVFYFEYGVVVMWGFTDEEERKLLKEVAQFEEEKLAVDDMETEQFHYHYNDSYQPRIYNDVITLKNPNNYMVKLTISHAIAQSTKMTLFEGLIENTINATKHIPETMSETGKVHMSRTAITKKIGQLFMMRINVNLVSNVLDTPEIFWSEPALEPLYTAIRGYLEISQRVELLNQRVSVISDLLDMLKEHLTSSHGEQLEWIVIILIAFEIVLGILTMTIDATSLHKA